MWPFKTKTKEEEYEEGYEWEQSGESEEYWEAESGGGWYYYEEEEEESPRGISVKAFVLALAGVLYLSFLAIGIFSTDFAGGRGYIVPAELRKERAYVAELRPYYEVLVRVPEAAETLEKSEKNPIDLQYKLQQLQKAVSNFKLASQRMTPPAPYAAYQEYLVSLANKEFAWLSDKIAYHQDGKEERLRAIGETKQDILYQIEQAKRQMAAIEERLVSNQAEPKTNVDTRGEAS